MGNNARVGVNPSGDGVAASPELVIYPFNSGTMDWRPFSIAQSDLPAAIEDHKAELREMAAKRAATAPEPTGGSYAAAKMRS